MAKKYKVYGGINFYPKGELDVIGEFDSMSEALNCAWKADNPNNEWTKKEWAYIINTQTNDKTIVYGKC